MTLQEIGKLFGTDKSDEAHSFHGISYLDVYESHIAPFKVATFEVRNVLEIGVLHGASLKMWSQYFPTAQIVGLDINPESNKEYGSRIKVITGSQIDPEAIKAALSITNGKGFDFVIDDGSHLVDHAITTFNLLWPFVRPGGIYAIEDLACFYDSDVSKLKDVWPGMALNPDTTNFINSRQKMDRFFLEKIWEMDALRGDVQYVHFHPMQCIIRKVK